MVSTTQWNLRASLCHLLARGIWGRGTGSAALVQWSVGHGYLPENGVGDERIALGLWHRKPPSKLIHRFYYGAQHTSVSFDKKLEEAGIVPCMGKLRLDGSSELTPLSRCLSVSSVVVARGKCVSDEQ